MVLIDPDVAELSADSAAVNEALRALLRIVTGRRRRPVRGARKGVTRR